MIFSLKEGKSIWMEILEQCLHALLASLYMLFFILQLPAEVAALLSFGYGVLRELEQHQWQSVGKQDLFFWGLACVIFVVVYRVVFGW